MEIREVDRETVNMILKEAILKYEYGPRKQ